ncbi:hypothetical protein L218DRAFT_715733 [Marasmius fiardii PR-910]|nr:hypothetical protein L218DRAFT_715733 [Marasmius fiardii PR-910]
MRSRIVVSFKFFCLSSTFTRILQINVARCGKETSSTPQTSVNLRTPSRRRRNTMSESSPMSSIPDPITTLPSAKVVSSQPSPLSRMVVAPDAPARGEQTETPMRLRGGCIPCPVSHLPLPCSTHM